MTAIASDREHLPVDVDDDRAAAAALEEAEGDVAGAAGDVEKQHARAGD